jgi:hypothetical protein
MKGLKRNCHGQMEALSQNRLFRLEKKLENPYNTNSFIYQQIHFISVLENIKIYIKNCGLCVLCAVQSFTLAQHTAHTPLWT